MSDEHPNPPEYPVPPEGAEPVPPAQHPVPPAGADQQYPVPPGQADYPPVQQPVPPSVSEPVPPTQYPEQVYPQQPEQAYPQQPVQPQVPPHQPQQPTVPGFETIQIVPGGTPQQPPPINQPAPGQIPPPNNPAPVIGAAAGAATARRRPATGGRRPAKKTSRKAASGRYPRRPQPVDPGLSVGSVLMAILGVIMLAVSVMALLPTSLIHIDGYPADDMTNKEPRNLLADAQKILEDRTEDVSFSEQEVNEYLNFRLQGQQKGALKSLMNVKGIYVDLRPNEAEIYVVRSFPLVGQTTISSIVKSTYNDQKHQQVWKTGGGSVGKINIPGRSLQPVMNAFLRMSKVAKPELEVMDYMADVKIGEDKITLDSAL